MSREGGGGGVGTNNEMDVLDTDGIGSVYSPHLKTVQLHKSSQDVNNLQSVKWRGTKTVISPAGLKVCPSTSLFVTLIINLSSLKCFIWWREGWWRGGWRGLGFLWLSTSLSGDHAWSCARRESTVWLERGSGMFTSHKLQLYVQRVYKTRSEKSDNEGSEGIELMPWHRFQPGLGRLEKLFKKRVRTRSTKAKQKNHSRHRKDRDGHKTRLLKPSRPDMQG